MQTDLHFSFFYTHLRICFHLFLEREEGKEERREGKERERNINVREKRRLVASHTQTADWMFLDRGLNPQPFDYRVMLQPTEPHWPGLHFSFLNVTNISYYGYNNLFN